MKLKILENDLIKKESGLTLIEMLLAAAIFAIGILGIVGIQGVLLRGNDFTDSMTTAKFLAGDRLSTLLFTAYTQTSLDLCGGSSFCHSDVDAGGGIYTPIPGSGPPIPLNNQGHIEAQGRWTRDWDIQPAPAPWNSSAKLIRVRVQWNDRPLDGGNLGRDREMIFSSILAQP